MPFALPVPPHPPLHAPVQQWDVFCQVIDNFGDMGVCWRLACNLADRGEQVRLWTDDASALRWMAPHGHAGVQVRDWHSLLAADEAPTDVLVEAFGCDAPADFIAACVRNAAASRRPPVWINLEYLSAEGYVERCHTLPSPVTQGPAAGWTKWFFYPGFTPATGGLLREPGLPARQQRFDAAAWRRRQWAGNGDAAPADARWISLFCYEPPALAALLAQCAQTGQAPVRLLVTPGRAAAATLAALQDMEHENGLQPLREQRDQLAISYLAPCAQPDFDEMLWACDLNLVRGEDSLVRALWAGQALVWHIYPQHDNAHHAKLQAFLDWLQAPRSLRQFHAVWNGVTAGDLVLPDTATLQEWRACVRRARATLWSQGDLLTQLLGFCAQKR